MMRSETAVPAQREATTHRWWSTAVMAIALVLALFATACGGSSRDTANTQTPSSTTPGETAATEAPSEPERESGPESEANTIKFEACGQGSECAVLAVPLDYESPDGNTTDIHITRHLATGDRVGAVFFNPGGPGGSVEDMVKGISQFGPPMLADRFDVVGIDPRGTGKSVPISCNDNWEEDVNTVVSTDDGLEDDVELLIADFSAMSADCAAQYGQAYLASVTTENAARDMETVRVALGGKQLNYVGYSYGTAIGSVYATLFPNSIRSMILDGAVPTDPAQGDLGGQAARIEVSLERLDLSCALWSECPVAETGLLNAYDSLREELEQGGEIGSLTLLTLNRAFVGMTVNAAAMPDVAQGLANALDGKGAMLHRIGSGFLSPIEGGGFSEFSGRFEAIVCADGWNMLAATSDELLGQAERTAASLLRLGPAVEIPCDLWPVSGEGIAAVNYTGDVPILVIGNSHDPITPLAWSEQLADDLGPNATLMTWDGSGHAVVFRGERCVDEAALAYLIDGTVPAVGTQCVLRGLMGIGHGDTGPVVINRITPGSAADEAGLQKGDRVVSENGNVIESAADFVIGAAGDVADIVIEREGEELALTLTRGTPVWELWRTEETLESAAVAGASNDLFEDAVIVDLSTLPFMDVVDTTTATSDANDIDCPAPTTDATVWYSITPTSDMQISVDAEGSDFSFGLSVLEKGPDGLELIECRPWGFTVEAEANVTYYLQVFDDRSDGGANGGNLVLTVDDAS